MSFEFQNKLKYFRGSLFLECFRREIFRDNYKNIIWVKGLNDLFIFFRNILIIRLFCLRQEGMRWI